MRLALLALASICPLAAQCALPTSILEYPAIARLAWVQGPVQVSLVVAPDGNATVKDVTGHPMLADPAKRVFAATKFRAECVGDRQISIEYVLRPKSTQEREQEIETLGPLNYRVTVNRPVTYIDDSGERPAPWYVRTRRAIFRR